MNAFIIEDEPIAYRNLSRMLEESSHSVEVIGWAQSVKQAKEWVSQNEFPDLVFLDVELGDGISFEIFEEIKADFPVIFTTAYHQYAIKAFELNSIAYLKKPFSQKKLDDVIGKLKKLNKQFNTKNETGINEMLSAFSQFQNPEKKFKTRFHVKKESRIFVVKAEEIAWFQKEDLVFMTTKVGDRFMIDYSLDQLAEMLNPTNFYRLNRQFITNIDAIERIGTYFNYKLKITLNPNSASEVLVAKDKAKKFKEWLG
ncbi:MAG: two-component system LytT family response regulator [Flammeovirgaceae bacterium]|jgi:two-component system LytT family response regulator